MLKHILKLEGAQTLNKKEQKSINGGGTAFCGTAQSCGDGSRALWGLCVNGCQIGFCAGPNVSRPCR